VSGPSRFAEACYNGDTEFKHNAKGDDMATKSGGDKPAKLKLKVNARSGESGSAQVAQQLREMINAGRLKAGDVMPSEDGLAEQMGVGRKIVRAAYGTLVDEGLLLRDFPRNKRVAGEGKAAKAGGKASGKARASAGKSGGKSAKK
jgi:GntR family transcriptional regulator/MocR family aminotransferase